MSYVQTKTHNNDFSTTPADILTFATFQPLSTTKKMVLQINPGGTKPSTANHKCLHPPPPKFLD